MLIFSGLTAYDIQRLKTMQAQGFARRVGQEGRAIFGALRLYLDFINLFISLLRIFGARRRPGTRFSLLAGFAGVVAARDRRP